MRDWLSGIASTLQRERAATQVAADLLKSNRRLEQRIAELDATVGQPWWAEADSARSLPNPVEQRLSELLEINQSMKRTGTRLAGATDPAEILSSILLEFRLTVGAIAAVVFGYEPDRRELSLLYVVENSGEVATTIPDFPWGDSSRPLPVSDFHQWDILLAYNGPRYEPVTEDEPWHKRRGHRGVLRQVLKVGDRPYGLMVGAFLDDRCFSDLELELVDALAHQATIALQMASLQRRADADAAEAAAIMERTRVAGDLHDTLMQTVHGTNLLIAHSRARQAADDALRDALGTVALWIARALEEGRAALDCLQHDQVPGSVAAELERAVHERYPRLALSMRFIESGTRTLRSAVRSEVYRIGFEAIRNACVHSGGTEVVVTVDCGEHAVLRVRDNGCGIDDETLQGGRPGHFGLVGMRERASQIGGRLEVVAANPGTEVVLVVPGAVAFVPAHSAPDGRVTHE